eukprot:TRINITY_DN4002_c0_g1_i7.p2 TRINITY_DN4002_c0_g1~~TRINITY_DN4002_c0_g1_i7.p2  ORF type:complete len:200 (+),score=-7.96 TRINITY_DN4002_c0_g1_i7:1201-1800(+)
MFYYNMIILNGGPQRISPPNAIDISNTGQCTWNFVPKGGLDLQFLRYRISCNSFFASTYLPVNLLRIFVSKEQQVIKGPYYFNQDKSYPRINNEFLQYSFQYLRLLSGVQLREFYKILQNQILRIRSPAKNLHEMQSEQIRYIGVVASSQVHPKIYEQLLQIAQNDVVELVLLPTELTKKRHRDSGPINSFMQLDIQQK